MSTNPEAAQWVADYVSTLPPAIRPLEADMRFQYAAAAAWKQGWTGKQAAIAVAGRSYDTARNPALIAIVELERIAQRPPMIRAPRPRGHASGCLVCAPGQTCHDPVTTLTRPSHARARMALLRRLMHTPNLSEAEREHDMLELIEEQLADLRDEARADADGMFPL